MTAFQARITHRKISRGINGPMNRRLTFAMRIVFLVFCIANSLAIRSAVLADEPASPTTDSRVLWTSSRVVGSPEPPLPYTVEAAFTSITWERPIYAKAEPGTDNMLVVQQGGEQDKPAKIFRVRDEEAAQQAELLLDIDKRLVYGLEFHPAYPANGQFFVFSNGPTGAAERKNRISRFTVTDDEPRHCDPMSEQVLIEWRSMGHDGGDLVFGHDGMLYITSGDGTSDSDGWLSGQDITNLLGGVLRIDVDHPNGDVPYSVPPDNPFVDRKEARGELWAFGLRNPWRMTIDRETGQIWVGNNGQDLWETAHLLGRGENYGWSVYEGNHPFYLNRQRGPAPHVAPTIEHHHREFRSLTGGVVYYGGKLPDLKGTYVYGDYATGKIWGARHDGTRLVWHQELADTNLQIAGFAVTPRGDLLVVDHGRGLFHLTQNHAPKQTGDFPRLLSETGLFASTKEHRVQPGVTPYSTLVTGWTDGAHIERFLALPGDSQMKFNPSSSWDLPNGAVLMQTLSFHPATESDAPNHRIETRLLTRQDGEWAGYSYRWNDAQDDAVLVAKNGAEIELPTNLTSVGALQVKSDTKGEADDTSNASAPQRWRFPSRTECMSCHSRAATFVLGLSGLQIDPTSTERFAQLGLFSNKLPKSHAELPRLVNPYDESRELEARVRSYLQVNCASCHVNAGGGNSRMEFGFSQSRDDMKIVSIHPQHHTFGVEQALLVAPGAPERSMLYQRVSRRGSGQMPPLVSNLVDHRAARMLHDWIAEMKPERKFVRDWQLADLEKSLDELKQDRSSESGLATYRELGCIQCHRMSGEGGGAGPDLTSIAQRLKPRELLESIIHPSKQIAPEFATTVILTTDGRVVQGRLEDETKSTVKLRPADPFAAPVVMARADIESQKASPQSIMPTGQLNSLEKHQILDLIAFLLSNTRDRPGVAR
ncbi:MAG: heme-binding domain-containing protein [Planctomycetaceae bacterium]|nr:heme-binding domain-containing protein [Planctomycetaceae bacterium]